MKALRTAAFVVGAVALIATGIGAGAALAGVATTVAAGATAATAATFATIATIAQVATVAAAGLSIAASLAKPKGTLGGNATKFTIDKESGQPYAIGRTESGGKVAHRQYHGSKNVYETWVTIHSVGPVKSLGPLKIDKVAQSFSGSAAVGGFAGFMWLVSQLGACPEASALTPPIGPVPGWSSTSKLSGLAADLWTLKFDTKGKKYPNGVPQRSRVIEGVYVYDPRLDSTYPGGSGSCRLGNEATYVWSENPALHALTWAYGRYQNGVLVAGGGLDVTGIDVRSAAEWANTCDANGWKAGGIVFTQVDNSWDILRMIAQAGGGEPQTIGGVLSFTFSAPRVSLATITSNDVSGEIDAPSTASMRQRRNTYIPKVRLESHGWEVVPLDPVTIADYVNIDGAKRPKEEAYPLVQDANQAAQLATYDILNGRELDPIVLPLKVYALGYLPGDCLTLQIPEANLIGRQVMVRTRQLSASSFGVTLGCRTETAGKHAFALGKTGTPPPTPDLSIPPISTDAPSASDWTLDGAELGNGGATLPALVISGDVGDPNAEAVIFDYRPYSDGLDDAAAWLGASVDAADTTRKVISSVAPGAQYQAGVRYQVRGVVSDRLILGPVTAGQLSTARSAHQILEDTMTVVFPVSSTTTTISVQAFSAMIDNSVYLSFPAATFTGLTPGTQYLIIWDVSASAYQYAPVTSAAALAMLADGDNVIVRRYSTANADGTYPSSPTPPGGDGGGGYACAEETSEYLLANEAGDGPGETIVGTSLRTGMKVWTRHEHTAEWMAAEVVHVSRHRAALWTLAGHPDTSAGHLWGSAAGWTRMDAVGAPLGREGWVLKIEVAEAHTYMVRAPGSEWRWSHNKRVSGDDL